LTNYEMYITVIVDTCMCEDLHLESIGICKKQHYLKRGKKAFYYKQNEQ